MEYINQTMLVGHLQIFGVQLRVEIHFPGMFPNQVGSPSRLVWKPICFQMERFGPGWWWQVLPMELCAYGDWGFHRNYEPLLCVLTVKLPICTWHFKVIYIYIYLYTYSHFLGYFLLVSSIVEACRILRRCSTRAGSRWIPVDGKFHLSTWLQGVVIGRGVMSHKS